MRERARLGRNVSFFWAEISGAGTAFWHRVAIVRGFSGFDVYLRSFVGCVRNTGRCVARLRWRMSRGTEG
jgi:hypothetical protein